MSADDQRRTADNPALSVKRRRSGKLHRSDDEFSKGLVRLVRALGYRLEEGDPDGAPLLAAVEAELDAAWSRAVAGWRASGFSDARIGEALGVTKQAVQKRWPRQGEAA